MQQIVATFRLQDIEQARLRLAKLRVAGIKCWMTRNLGPMRHGGYLMVFMERPREFGVDAERQLAGKV